MESDNNNKTAAAAVAAITKFTAPLTVASTSITPIVVVNSKTVREANNILSGSGSNNKSTSGLQLIKDKFDNLKCSSVIHNNNKNKNNNNASSSSNHKKHDTMLLNNKNLSVSVSVSAVPVMKQQTASNGLNHKNNNNNNKKDIMPSPAVPALVSVTSKTLGKNKGVGMTKLQKDLLQDPDDRKKRCADRYDSSESSDR